MDYPKVSITILNWNGWKDTVECLESLYQINYPNYDVVLVDNGSEDESLEKIRDYCGGKIKIESNFFKYSKKNKPITIFEHDEKELKIKNDNNEINSFPSNRELILIKNDKNCGFTEGNNIAMRYILKSLNSDYTLLLNNDTVVDTDFLDELITAAENDPHVGIIGPKIYYYDENNMIFSIGGKINPWTGRTPFIGWGETDKGQFEDVVEVDYVSGCALLIRNDLIKKIGLLNEDYFSYYEETEWCVKAKIAGYFIICNPKSKIWHKIAVTSKKSDLYIYYITRNRFLFLKRNFSKLQFFVSSLIFFITYLPLITIENTYGKNWNSLKTFFKAVRNGLMEK